MQVELQYQPTPELRRNHLIATGEALPTHPSITVELAELTSEQRAIIVRCGINHENVVQLPGEVIGVERTREPEFRYKPDVSRPGVYVSSSGDFGTLPTAEEWIALAAVRLATHDRWQPELDAAIREVEAQERQTQQRIAELTQQYDALRAEWEPKIAQMSLEEANPPLPQEIRDIEAELRTLNALPRPSLSDMKSYRYDQALKELREAEKATWITAYGSEHLRRAFDAGYNCQRLYVTERAALEAPGFVVDFDGRIDWRDRSCPSEAALDVEEAARERGLNAQTVWLTVGPSVDDAHFEPTEAVVIFDYLGRYKLVKIIN